MKRPALLIPVALLTACAQPLVTPDTHPLGWLAGCWRTERDGSIYEEMWLPPAPDGMLGAAREVRGGRTVFHEFTRIELRADGSAAYIAQPKGQAPVEFPLIERAQGRVVFENLRHDFPTRIEYRWVAPDAMHARASGLAKGQPQASDYPMRRVGCEG